MSVYVTRNQQTRKRRRRKVNLDIVLEIDLRNDLRSELPFFIHDKQTTHNNYNTVFNSMEMQIDLGRKFKDQQRFGKALKQTLKSYFFSSQTTKKMCNVLNPVTTRKFFFLSSAPSWLSSINKRREFINIYMFLKYVYPINLICNEKFCCIICIIIRTKKT